MKRIICAIVAVVMMLSCASAEKVTAKAWQHEAGWISFALALSQDGLEDAWEAGAKVFGPSIGVPMMTGEMLKSMSLQGYNLGGGVDELSVNGSRFTGKAQDGTTLFDFKYTWVETLEQADIMDGKKVFVFRTKDKSAGNYTYLLLTEPVKAEGDNAGYVTFNLIHAKKKNYRKIFDLDGKGTGAIPCTMIEKDTGTDGLKFAIDKLYGHPVVIK